MSNSDPNNQYPPQPSPNQPSDPYQPGQTGPGMPPPPQYYPQQPNTQYPPPQPFYQPSQQNPPSQPGWQEPSQQYPLYQPPQPNYPPQGTGADPVTGQMLGRPSQPPAQPPARSSFFRRKVGCMPMWLFLIVCLLVLGMCGIFSTGFHSSPTDTGSQPAAAATSGQSTPTDTPVPTDTPTPTPKPVPTTSPAQLEATYKASTTNTTVNDLSKEGSNWSGKDVHFTATISNLVKDDSGNTAGANVEDPNNSGVFVQIAFPDGTDISQVNNNDTIEVWGTDSGTQSGQNAFGATIQEVVVSANYITDQTTGYKH